jgi:hypothetical protein
VIRKSPYGTGLIVNFRALFTTPNGFADLFAVSRSDDRKIADATEKVHRLKERRLHDSSRLKASFTAPA